MKGFGTIKHICDLALSEGAEEEQNTFSPEILAISFEQIFNRYIEAVMYDGTSPVCGCKKILNVK